MIPQQVEKESKDQHKPNFNPVIEKRFKLDGGKKGPLSTLNNTKIGSKGKLATFNSSKKGSSKINQLLNKKLSESLQLKQKKYTKKNKAINLEQTHVNETKNKTVKKSIWPENDQSPSV